MDELKSRIKALMPKLSHPNWKGYDFAVWTRINQEKYYEYYLKWISLYATSLKNKKILDIGCGMGGLPVLFALKKAKVVGIDFNEDYLEISRLRAKKYGLNVSFMKADALKLPFSRESFDIVSSLGVIEHVKRPKDLVHQAEKVLRKKGLFLLHYPCKFAMSDEHFKLFFVNLLPKSVSRALVKLFKREHDYSNMLDLQEIDKIHVFTFRGIRKLLGKKFDVRKINSVENRVRDPSLVNPNHRLLKTLLTLMGKLRLNILLIPIAKIIDELKPGADIIAIKRE